MSEHSRIDETADTVQFQRIEDVPHSGPMAPPPRGRGGAGPERTRGAKSDRVPTKRMVFKARTGPDMWLIAAIMALVAAVAVFIGGVVVSQVRDSTPTYESVYVPQDSLGGAQR